MEKKLVFGAIGLMFGNAHLEGALAYGAEVAAICDLNEETLRKSGEKYNIPEEKWTTDYHDLLNNPDINMVSIAIPDQLHRQVACEFLAAGKHVLCEKPLALTREDVEAMVQATEKSSAKFMVGQICRFTPAFAKAKEIIDSGMIGELYFVESEYAHDYMNIVKNADGSKHWRADPQRHGLIGGGCHAVDLLRWLAGDPVEVFAYGTHKLLPTVPYDDATCALMKFDDELMGKVFVSTGCKRDYTMRTCIYGTKGTIICDNTSPTMQLFVVDEKDEAPEKPEIIEIDVNNHNYVKEFQVFADTILADKEMETSVYEGAKTVEVCLAIIESAQKEEKVKPNYNFN